MTDPQSIVLVSEQGFCCRDQEVGGWGGFCLLSAFSRDCLIVVTAPGATHPIQAVIPTLATAYRD